MVGRDQELARLHASIQRARQGETVTVLVLGEAGVGKTRLVAEVVRGLRSAGDLVLTGHGVKMATGEMPYAVASEILRDLARQQQRNPEALPPVDLTAFAPLLPDLVQQAGAPGALDRVAVLGSFASLLQHLAETRLVCCVVEDLQWTDGPSRDLVTYVSRVAGESRIVLVCTARVPDADPVETSEPLSELIRSPATEVIQLDRLNRKDTADLVRHISPELPNDALEPIIRLSDGIPFYVEQCVASYSESKRTVPATVQRLVLAETPALSQEARGVVEAAALAKVDLHDELLQAVTGLLPPQFDEAVSESVDRGILEVDEGHHCFRFRHALLREAVEDGLLPGRRRYWHRRWAESLSAVSAVLPDSARTIAAAYHLLDSDDVQKAFPATIRAAESAGKVGVLAQEIELWDQALALWESVDRPEELAGMSRDSLLSKAWWAGYLAGDCEGALRRVEAELAESSPSNDWLRQLWLDTFRCWMRNELLWSDEDAVPADTLDDVLSRLDSCPPSTLVLDILAMLLWQFHDRRPDAVRPRVGALERMAEELGNLRVATMCMDMRARHAMETGDLEAMYRLKREAYDRVRPVDPAWARTFENGIVGSLSLLGRHREALAFGLAAMHRYPDPTMPWLEEWRTQGTGWSYLAYEVAGTMFALGQWRDAQRLLDAARKLVREGDLIVSLSAQAAILAARQGSFEEAAALTAEASEHRRRANMPSAGTAGQLRELLTADTAAVRGDVIAMRRAASHIWEDPRIEEGSAGFWEILLNAVRAEVAALGDPYLEDVDREPAIAHLAILRRVAGRLHRSGDVDNASWREVQSLFARVEGRDTVDTWRNAVESWAAIGQVYDEAICRTRYAESLLTAGDRDGCRSQLLTAMQTAERLGAQPLIADIRRVAGRAHLEIAPHQRSPETEAAHHLTVRELEVLELIAFGRTNEQIAHQLYMSPKTASVHVSRILTKLGATNRTEAARIARDEALLQR